MAELLVASPLVKVVLGKLGSVLWTELESLRSVKEDVEKLQSTLSTINDVLEGAENRLVYDKPLCNWLKKLRDAAFDADDVVDEFLTEVTRRMVENHDSLIGQRNFMQALQKMTYQTSSLSSDSRHALPCLFYMLF